MDDKEIKKLLKKSESSTLEFKGSFDNETIETIGSFSNAKGGIILIGVTDKAKIKGIEIGKGTINSWLNQISNSIEPRVIPDIEPVVIDKANIVAISVKEFPVKPVAVKGKCFKRVSSSNRMLTPQEITQMHMQSTGMSFDALESPNSTKEDLDVGEIKGYIKKANHSGRRKIKETAKFRSLEPVDFA